jgi:hypothetical protein
MKPPGESSRPSKFSNAQTLLYEIDMFRFAAENFTKEDGPKEWRNLECFLLHFRNLIEFFGTDPKNDNLSIKNPKAIWGDLTPTKASLDALHRPDLWRKYEKPQDIDPRKPNDKISRYLHHCTEQRIDPKTWPIAEMFNEIAPVISKFEELLRYEDRPWKDVLRPKKLEYLPKASCNTATARRVDSELVRLVRPRR